MIARIVIAVAVVWAAGCSNSTDLHLDPDDLIGCRAPTEDGCDKCCLRSDVYAPDGNGWVVEDSFGTNQYVGTGIDVNNVCPTGGFPACARCSLQNEADLRALAAHPVCDCDGVDLGIDPCEQPNSCECYCENLDTLQAVCTE